MSMMTKNLSDALKFASATYCNGYEIDLINYLPGNVIRLECADAFSVEIPDQSITINATGEAEVVHIDDDCDQEVLNFEFRVSVPIRECDFA